MRSLTSERIKEIVARHRPRGWRIRESKHRFKAVSACANIERRTLYVPTLCDANSLFLFLHECGHVRMRHWDFVQPAHREEYEAEQYAVHVFRSEGVTLPRSVIADARARVARIIEDDQRRNVPIQAHVKRWAVR